MFGESGDYICCAITRYYRIYGFIGLLRGLSINYAGNLIRQLCCFGIRQHFYDCAIYVITMPILGRAVFTRAEKESRDNTAESDQ